MPTALVVDDNDSIRRLITRVLERDGIHADEARSGEEALQMIDRNGREYDVILLDLMMMPGSGFDVIRALGEHQPDLLGRVIVMTAATGHLANEELGRVRTTLKKPFLLTDLREAIRNCIRGERPAQSRVAGEQKA